MQNEDRPKIQITSTCQWQPNIEELSGQGAEMAGTHQKRSLSLKGVWKELQSVSDEEIEAAKQLWTVLVTKDETIRGLGIVPTI
ncbi:hypothetical protein HYR99_26670 [Candidatus Poribacteria bacterium]|nr:hypothetical protein [Candidatus Poribacteria bacterium]